jgi:RNA 3'-terminal phosphate cyclase (ATP)
MLMLDGSHGEGGGQVLRAALSLSAVTGRPVHLVRIRAGRRKPGLQPQHLTAVRAAARVCSAHVEGDKLDSQEITFAPGSPPQAGTYTFDVSQAAKGGSAGAVSLVFQTVLLPLALARGTSHLTLRGGTHVAWSPSFDFLKRVYLPALARMGLAARVQIEKWGWYPVGGGEVLATVQGAGAEGAAVGAEQTEPPAAIRTPWTGLDLSRRGKLLRVRGLSASSNLPKHIRTRQEGAALHALRSQGVDARIDVVDAPSKGQGTAVFLWAESEGAAAGFTSLGALGKPAEQVADEAAKELLAYLHGEAALDRHLADQLVLPLALADGRSEVTTEEVTQHLLTVAWVVNQFFPGRVCVEGAEGQPGQYSTGGSAEDRCEVGPTPPRPDPSDAQ